MNYYEEKNLRYYDSTCFFNYVNINLIVLERKDINEYIILKESAELDNLLKKDDKILIYFYQKDCMACNDFKGILNEVIVDKKLQVYGVDLNGSGFNYSDLITKYNLTKTPSVIAYKNKIEEKRVEGTISKERFLQFIED